MVGVSSSVAKGYIEELANRKVEVARELFSHSSHTMSTSIIVREAKKIILK